MFRVLAMQAGDVAAAASPGVERGWSDFRLAQLALAEGDPARAHDMLSARLARYPESPYRAVLHLEPGRAFLALGEANPALADVSAAIDYGNRDARTAAMFDRGAAALGQRGQDSAFTDSFGRGREPAGRMGGAAGTGTAAGGARRHRRRHGGFRRGPPARPADADLRQPRDAAQGLRQQSRPD